MESPNKCERDELGPRVLGRFGGGPKGGGGGIPCCLLRFLDPGEETRTTDWGRGGVFFGITSFFATRGLRRFGGCDSEVVAFRFSTFQGTTDLLSPEATKTFSGFEKSKSTTLMAF